MLILECQTKNSFFYIIKTDKKIFKIKFEIKNNDFDEWDYGWFLIIDTKKEVELVY